MASSERTEAYHVGQAVEVQHVFGGPWARAHVTEVQGGAFMHSVIIRYDECPLPDSPTTGACTPGVGIRPLEGDDA